MFSYMLRARVKKLLDGDEEQQPLLDFVDAAIKVPDHKQVLEVRRAKILSCLLFAFHLILSIQQTALFSAVASKGILIRLVCKSHSR